MSTVVEMPLVADMPSCKEEPAKVDPRIMSPTIVIEVGYNLYLIDQADTGEAVRKMAQAAINHFEALLAIFDPISPEGGYCMTLRMAATSLARGIERRKRNLAEQIALADREYDEVILQVALSQRVPALLKLAMKLLLIGGAVYILASMVIGKVPAPPDQVTTNSPGFPLAITLAVAVAGLAYSEWWILHHNRKVRMSYKKAIAEAHAEYARTVVQEYRFAAQLGEFAYEKLTGTRAPVTPGFQNLLEGIMGSCVTPTYPALLAEVG